MRFSVMKQASHQLPSIDKITFNACTRFLNVFGMLVPAFSVFSALPAGNLKQLVLLYHPSNGYCIYRPVVLVCQEKLTNINNY